MLIALCVKIHILRARVRCIVVFTSFDSSGLTYQPPTIWWMQYPASLVTSIFLDLVPRPRACANFRVVSSIVDKTLSSVQHIPTHSYLHKIFVVSTSAHGMVEHATSSQRAVATCGVVFSLLLLLLQPHKSVSLRSGGDVTSGNSINKFNVRHAGMAWIPGFKHVGKVRAPRKGAVVRLALASTAFPARFLPHQCLAPR